ncbi:MAG: glycosyltransferase family 39 protein [Acidobacteriaceae bacterium]
MPARTHNRRPDLAPEPEAPLRPILAPHEPQSSIFPRPQKSPLRWVYAFWIAGVVALFALHFPHLLADFPNHSPWLDPSKYTDEGWYGNAATRWYLSGHWFLRGDFNPAVALPIWPLLLAAVFHFTGVSLAADRALDLFVFGLNLLLTYFVVRTQAAQWVALLAVTILVTSPFLYAFSRLAILETPLICLLLLSWLLALRLPHASSRAQTLMLAAIGLLACLMILTKTTAVFILPSTLFLIAHAYRFRWASLRALATVIAAAALPWGAWYFLLVRPHYRLDYQYLFDANHWAQPTTFTGWIAAFWYALHGSLWISPTLCVTAVALLALSLVPSRATNASELRPSGLDSGENSGPVPHLWTNPVILASLLAAAGYLFFAGWHNNPQPRYYEAVIYPLSFILALGAARLLPRSRPLLLRIAGAAAIAIVVTVCIAGVFRIASYVRHPDYTFLNAARGVTNYIDSHPHPHRLLLSISGDSIQMITRLPAICDDYGTWDLPYRIHAYQPGWYATWNEMDPGTLTDLQTQYSLEQVASFPAFDDPDRNLLILYRLIPLPPAKQTYLTQQEQAGNTGK